MARCESCPPPRVGERHQPLRIVRIGPTARAANRALRRLRRFGSRGQRRTCSVRVASAAAKGRARLAASVRRPSLSPTWRPQRYSVRNRRSIAASFRLVSAASNRLPLPWMRRRRQSRRRLGVCRDRQVDGRGRLRHDEQPVMPRADTSDPRRGGFRFRGQGRICFSRVSVA